ncbi:eukaryotic translation initiation factor 3 subunit A [Elasticomyces elasticus]|nr:eukaryotic translation initiation factor 3 subunit A [Elasticomyces elasticus]
MPPPPHTKPENVLKRAQELVTLNNKQAALNVLHEHVTSKRTRNSTIAALEPVMLLFVELCVDLKKGKSAKDGLYNYKNTSQNTNVATIETVFRRFIELAEQKVAEAQAKADEVSTAAESTTLDNVGDLEAIETPESILLSTVSGEQSRDRTDRAIVTPWLKFLWETYRTVLDIFKNNARLEVMYQTTTHQAFQFCLKYTRKTEFRRLCELLRNHLQNAAKYSNQMHAINLNDPDTLQRHLDTRFQQLGVAVDLELWQEAFKSVEDTHTLLSLSKRPAKNVMMANYFEKLTRIFLVSENYLFHAAAWSRYYNLLRQSAAIVASNASAKKDNPTNTSDADLTKAASFVLLSALSIPVISTSRSRGALVDADEARKNKNTRLTNLLGMSQAPTRAILFKDALSKGLLKRCRPEIRDLYNILEVDFHPLSICKKISPILSQIGADPEMEKYVLPLQQVILTRLFQQLSQVYDTVELQFVLDLAQFPDPFQVSSGTIEKFIMNGCKKGDLSIRIDHATGVLTFDNDVFSSSKSLHPGSGAGSAEAEVGTVQRLQSTPAEIVRSQLTRLAKALYVTCQYVDPTFNEDRKKAKAAALARAAAGAQKENLDLLERRGIIERKKESAAKAAAAKEADEANRKRIRAQEALAAETERLAAEQKDREQKRLQAEKQRVQREEMEKQLKELKQGVKGVDLASLDIDDLDTGRIRQMKLAALEKEKNELGEKLRITGKRIDHLERAYRREELKHMSDDYETQRKKDLDAYEKSKKETFENAAAKHKEDVALKHRLSRLVSPFEQFRHDISQQRAAEFEKRRRQAEKELQQKMDQRRREVRERIARERSEEEDRQRREREEEETRIREEEEKTRVDEEKKAKAEEVRAQRAKEREYVPLIYMTSPPITDNHFREAAAKQKLQQQREEEAEARRRERKAGAAAPPARTLERSTAPDTTTPSESRAPPKIPTKSGGWREREAAKAAGPTIPSASPAPADAAPPAAPPTDVATPEAALPRRSGYVPPHLREGATKRDGEAPPAPAPRERDGTRDTARPSPFAAHERDSASGTRDGGRETGRWQGGRPRPAESEERSESPAVPASGGSYRAPGAGKSAGGGGGAPQASGGRYVPPSRRA